MKITYSNNRSPVTKAWKRIINIGELDLSSLEWASTALPAGVLSADSQLLGEVFSRADLIDTKKRKVKFIYKATSSFKKCLSN